VRWVPPTTSVLTGSIGTVFSNSILILQIRLIARGLPPCLAETAPILSFSQTLDTLPTSSAWAIQEYALPSDLKPILQALSSGSARAVSNGSFKDKSGTSAFTVVDDDETSILGLNVVPGHPDDQSAYRSELAGLFGIVMLVNLLSKWAGILGGVIEVRCDGLSTLNKAFDTWPLDPDDPHFDMLNSLRTMITESPITWTTRHVDGHQDDDINATLDWWARQNTQMDNLAKVFWMNHSHSAPVQYSISHEGFQVWLGDHKLSSSPSSVFFDHIHGKTILAWHATHHRFPACYVQCIDWAVGAAALKRLPMGRR
jgi:hypothetical protein